MEYGKDKTSMDSDRPSMDYRQRSEGRKGSVDSDKESKYSSDSGKSSRRSSLDDDTFGPATNVSAGPSRRPGLQTAKSYLSYVSSISALSRRPGLQTAKSYHSHVSTGPTRRPGLSTSVSFDGHALAGPPKRPGLISRISHMSRLSYRSEQNRYQEIEPTTDIWQAEEKPAITHGHEFDSATIFDCPPRKPLKVNPFKLVLNGVLAFGVLGALLAGYAIGVSVFSLGITSVGVYGTVLISIYIIQVTCAVLNRVDVNRIVRHLQRARDQNAPGYCEKGANVTSSTGVLNPGAEVSIAVVGYREDEKAWRECLRSLQPQTLQAKCIIGVVDGNEEPDLSMANAFVSEFESYNAPLIHLPSLLSDLHRDTYLATVPVDDRSRLRKFGHWLSGGFRPGHKAALAVARQAIVDQVLEWDLEFNISGNKAVVFSQPHGHKRTAMFTSFAMALYAFRTRDAIFTTDSDTLVRENALDEMLSVLRSAPQIGGVTADVKIWNRREGLLARLCAARYW